MLVERMIRAARLESGLYDEVERDLSATPQALWVVVIVGIVSGIGGALGALFSGHPGQAVGALAGGIIGGVIGWIVWSFITYFIGTRVFGGTATPGELLRTLGYATTPQLLGFFSFIWLVGGLIGLAAAIWSLVAGVIAVRQALDFDTSKAVFTVILGWLAMLAVTMVLAILGLGAGFIRG